jgi:hypothetical protein
MILLRKNEFPRLIKTARLMIDFITLEVTYFKKGDENIPHLHVRELAYTVKPLSLI